MSYLDESHRIETGEAELYVEQVGPEDAQTLLYLHGGPGYSSASFRDLVGDELTDLRVVYQDQRGGGRSFASSPFELDDLADDVERIAEALGLGRITVLAHGFGAIPAVVAANNAPGLIERLVLVNPWLSMPLLARDIHESARAFLATGKVPLPSPVSGDGASDAGGEGELPAAPPADAGALVDEAFAQVNPKVLLDAMEFPQASARLLLEHADATVLSGPNEVEELLDMWNLDVLDVLPAVRQATVFMVGTRDATCYPNQAEAALARMPGALVTLLEVGHYPWLEDQDAFLGMLRQALEVPPST